MCTAAGCILPWVLHFHEYDFTVGFPGHYLIDEIAGYNLSSFNIMGLKVIPPKFLITVLALGGLQSLVAVGVILSQPSDPKNVLLLGFSAARLFIVVFMAILGAVLMFFSLQIHREGIPDQLQNLILENSSLLRSLSITGFLLGVIILLTPPSQLGKYSEYFERIQPLLIVLTTVPFQLLIPIIFMVNRKTGKDIVKPSLVALCVLFILCGFIFLTKLGVEPEHHFWNVAGVPLTTLQLMVVFLITTISFYIIEQLSTFPKVSSRMMDIGSAVLIYLIGASVWSQTPMVKQFFALRPAPPAFQYFPFSDARDLDMGSLSVINGYGINFGEYTDKPLYIILLSALHLIAGHDYNLLSLLHLYGIAFILPGLYWLGQRFHSRQFGIAIALVILIRQRNAIFLAHSLAGTNPRLLITELPTLLGIIILCNVVFSWLENKNSSQQSWPFALLAGGIVGAVSLIRLNPIGLLPVFYAMILLTLRKTGIKWSLHFSIFTLGFIMVFTPWVLTGQDARGQPYLWAKLRDVLAVRYPHIQSIEENDLAQLHAKAKYLSPGISDTDRKSKNLQIEEFPLFVINHSLHNMVASLLALPDSLSPRDQDLKDLIKRPYWDERQIWIWSGKLEARQVPFISLNLFFLAIGLGWSWNRWKWVGVFPSLVFVTYTVTLGLARTSGSRYIVPVDWIVFFYYVLGIILIIDHFSSIFVQPNQNPQLEKAGISLFVSPLHTISIVLLLAMLVPIAQIPVITRNFPSCESEIIDPTYEELKLVRGKALYPYLEKGIFSFVFFSCDERININIVDFDWPLQTGQVIVIGFSKESPTQPSMIFLDENSTITPIWPEQ